MSAIGAAAALQIGKELVFPWIERWVTGKEAQAQAKSDFTSEALTYRTRELEVSGAIITTEATGTEKQRNWRPDLMYLIMLFLKIYGIYLPVWNFLVRPIVNSLLYRWTCFVDRTAENFVEISATACIILPEIDPQKVWDGIPEEMWTFLTVSVGGYVVSRGVEKTLGAAVGPSFGEDVKDAMTRSVPGVVARTVGRAATSAFDRIRGRARPGEPGSDEDLYGERDDMTIRRAPSRSR